MGSKKGEEIWKDIEGFVGIYEISNFGNVRRKDNKRMKKTSLNYYGYPQVNLCKNGKSFLFRIHRLVALAFIPNPENLPMINHKDENPLNSHVDNLEWCDAKYNVNYGEGNKKRAKSHSKPIIQYTLDGEFVREWESATEAALITGYPQSGINNCCLHKPKYNSCKGYLWKYKNDNAQIYYKHGKPVAQFDLCGNLIKVYDNISEASKETGILATSISNSIHGRSAKAGDYKWILIKNNQEDE